MRCLIAAALIALSSSVSAASYSEMANQTAMDSKAQEQGAFEAARKAMTPSRPETIMTVADMHLMGMGTNKNIKEAFKLYNEASKQNYAPAQERIAFFYLNGEGVPEDRTKGVEWLQRAAKNGSAPAMLKLALHYKIGDAVKQSDQGYDFWFQKYEQANKKSMAAISTSAPQVAPQQRQRKVLTPNAGVIKTKEDYNQDRYGIGNL